MIWRESGFILPIDLLYDYLNEKITVISKPNKKDKRDHFVDYHIYVPVSYDEMKRLCLAVDTKPEKTPGFDATLHVVHTMHDIIKSEIGAD